MKTYKFTMMYNDKPYTDAVNLTDDHTKTDQEIVQMMLEKFISWKKLLETASEDSSVNINEESPVATTEETIPTN